MTVADELSRRLELWERISAGDAANTEPSALRFMRVYGGAQGIWVDKKTTGTLFPDGQGVTVSILHTGRHYPDDLSDDGLIYHYPTTHRPSRRDAAEVERNQTAVDRRVAVRAGKKERAAAIAVVLVRAVDDCIVLVCAKREHVGTR